MLFISLFSFFFFRGNIAAVRRRHRGADTDIDETNGRFILPWRKLYQNIRAAAILSIFAF